MVLKKIFKLSCYSILILLLFIAGYVGSAFFFSRIGVEHEMNSSKDVPIYLVTNGVHSDLILPVKSGKIDWSQEVKYENTLSKDSSYNYVAFGWGDKGFYLETPTWGDLKFSTAFKAAFSLGTSAVHTAFYRDVIEDENCKKIFLSQDQYERLVKYIKNSFQRDSEGRVIHIKTNANYGSNDAFYEGVGEYSLFHTCNTWVNNALKSSGQKAAFWTPSDEGIFYHYRSL